MSNDPAQDLLDAHGYYYAKQKAAEEQGYPELAEMHKYNADCSFEAFLEVTEEQYGPKRR
ncbi:hypothetical protein [Streptomyces sp. MNP-20]|uniref:hypothetical protein n=1 Tax=Streptomyces sp. MNP-20 TaxID=2721165 RepID=UPI001555D76D|nr:hypothetical protein [Streptomyces sp. MNP-20]